MIFKVHLTKTKSSFYPSLSWRALNWEQISRCLLNAQCVLVLNMVLVWAWSCGTRLQRTTHNSFPSSFAQSSIYESFPWAWGRLGSFRILVSRLSDNFRLLKSVCVPSVTWCHKQLVLPWQLYRIKVLLWVKLWVTWPSSVAGKDDTQLLLTSPPKQTQNSKSHVNSLPALPSLFDFVIPAFSTPCDTGRFVCLSPQPPHAPEGGSVSKESSRDSGAPKHIDPEEWPAGPTSAQCSSWRLALCQVHYCRQLAVCLRERIPLSWGRPSSSAEVRSSLSRTRGVIQGQTN